MIVFFISQTDDSEWEVVKTEGKADFVTTFSKLQAEARARQFIAWQQSLLGDEPSEVVECESLA